MKTARMATIFPMNAYTMSQPGNGISWVASETVSIKLMTKAGEARVRRRFEIGSIVMPAITAFCDHRNISNTDSGQSRETKVAFDSLARWVPHSLGSE